MRTKYINRISYTWLLLLVITSSGCQYMPKLPDMPDIPSIKNWPLIGGKEESSDSTEEGAEGIQAIVRGPNPYLRNRPLVAEDAVTRFELAKQAMRNKKWSQAQDDLEWLIENYPTYSGPYLNLALVHRQQEQPKDAERLFKRAITINSNNVNAYNQYAIFLRELGRFDDARVIYLKALEVWPDHPESNRNLGILYDLYMGKFDLALPYYKTYQSLLEEPDRKVDGWIADTERRVRQTVQQQTIR